MPNYAVIDADGLVLRASIGAPFFGSDGKPLEPGEMSDGDVIVEAADGVEPIPGQTHLGDGQFRTPELPTPPIRMPSLSDRQFGEGLWRDGLISFDDYLAFIGPGTIPPALLALIDTLDDDDTGGPTERKIALGLVTGATTYRFDDPLVEPVRAAFAQSDPTWTVEHLRERWAAWAAL